MLTKYKFLTTLTMALLSYPMMSEAQKPQTLGGKGQQTIVETTPGKFRRGWIVKTGTTQQMFVDISGERIDLPDNVTLYKIATLEKEFTKMQREVRKDDDRTAEYATLIEWARQRQLFEAVEQLAEKILKRNPANPNAEAQIARKWAREQLAVMKKTMSVGVDTGEFSMEDVQKIRFALLSPKAFGNTGPQIAFKNNLLKRFIEDMNETGQYQTREEQRDFLKLPPLEQALIIKQTTGNKYQPDITIGRDPKLILDFKATVQPILSRSCAQPACHGGNTTKLMLTAKTTSLPQTYYNYYTIDTFRTANGNIIDHARPEVDSLLINFVLPSNLAPKGLSHNPPIPPVLKTKDDPRYKPLRQWLLDQPTYPIDQLMSDKAVPLEDDQPLPEDTATGTQPAIKP